MQSARKNKDRKDRIAIAAFEALESRQLMSATVASSGGNDTAAIQNALNSAPAGQTVQLAAGTYRVSSTLKLNGHTLAGVAGQTTLDWTGGSGSYLAESGSNSELVGVTLNGSGFHVTDGSSNVIVTDNTIENVSSTAVDCQGGSNNLQVTHNTMQSIGGYAMVLYSINQSHIDYNTIKNIYEGIHAVNFVGAAAGNNCTFDYNTVTGITRHGIEIQNNWNNLSVGWNYVADFNVQPGGNSHIALSIATGPGAGGIHAQGVDVHDNVLLGNGPGVPSNPNYCFTAIEIMGDGAVVNHNYMANWGWAVLDGFTSNWQVTNNDYVGITSMNGKLALPENQGVAPSVTTGNVWIGSWDGTVPSAFSNAGVNGTGSSSSSAPAALVAAPTSLTAVSPNSGEIDLAWQDSTTANATYTIEIKSTYGNDAYVTVATIAAGTTSYSIDGLNPNWWYNISVTATASGQTSTAAFVQDQVQPPPAVSSIPVVSTTGDTGSPGSTHTTGSTGSTSSTGSTQSTGSSNGSTGKTSSTGSTSSTSTTGTTTTGKKKTKTGKSGKKVSNTPAPVAVAAAPGHGLTATFYKGHGNKKAAGTEVTADVNYTFAGKSKTVPALTSPAGKSHFNVVWTGQVEAPTTGNYKITSKANDTMKVWIDGRKVINDIDASANTETGSIKLVAGEKYDIKVRYFQKRGAGKAQLMWATKGVGREVIPDADLYLPAAA